MVYVVIFFTQRRPFVVEYYGDFRCLIFLIIEFRLYGIVSVYKKGKKLICFYYRKKFILIETFILKQLKVLIFTSIKLQ